MKSILTTVRLPDEIVKTIDVRAKDERLDRSTVLREFLEESIKNWKIEKAVQLYKEGKTSIGKSAEIAGITIGEMMDELIKRGIKSDMSIEEYKESLSLVYDLFN